MIGLVYPALGGFETVSAFGIQSCIRSVVWRLLHVLDPGYHRVAPYDFNEDDCGTSGAILLICPI